MKFEVRISVAALVAATFAGCGSSDSSAPPAKPAAAPVANAPPPAAPPSTPASVSAPAVAPSTAPAAVAKPSAKPAGASAQEVVLGSPDLTAGIPGEGPLQLAEIDAWLADENNHQPLAVKLPVGLDKGASQIKGLDANPLTRAKIELGRQLYFDPRLSADGKVSCATCHDPDQGYAKHTRFGVGMGGQQGGRNSPTAYNRILSDKQFWDGRAGSLEEQALGPIQNPIEMGNTHEACAKCMEGIPGYKRQFEKIFGKVTIVAAGQAVASFERAIVTGPSAFDYYESLLPFTKVDLADLKTDDPDAYQDYERLVKLAETKPMSDAAKRGHALFFGQKAGCSACHVGANLTDEKYHNLGVGMTAEKPDLGRAAISNDDKDTGAFKTPTIRNVALTAPYMHDGSQKTLAEVVDWYAKGGHPNPHLSDKIKKLDLTDQDKKDLVEFMNSCTGDFPTIERARLPE